MALCVIGSYQESKGDYALPPTSTHISCLPFRGRGFTLSSLTRENTEGIELG